RRSAAATRRVRSQRSAGSRLTGKAPATMARRASASRRPGLAGVADGAAASAGAAGGGAVSLISGTHLARGLHPFAVDLLLELDHGFEEGLGAGRAAGDVDVDGDDLVDAGDGAVAVVEAAAGGAGAGGDHPLGVRHLLVDAAQDRSLLVGHRAG